MDNIVVSNVLPSPSAGVVVPGGQVSSGGEDATPGAIFGSLLAKQIAAMDPKQTKQNQEFQILLDSADVQSQVASVVQPVDILSQIVDPALQAQQIESLGVGKSIANGNVVDTVKKDDLVNDHVENVDFTEYQSNAAIVSLLPSGNVQPTSALPTKTDGKDLPVASVGQSAAGVSVSGATEALSASTEKSDAEAAAFAAKLEAAIVDGVKQKHTEIVGGQTNNVTTPVTEKVANTAPTSAGIPQQVGTPHWDTGLGDKVVWMIGSQTQVAQLHLNPPNLGPLEVKLSMSDGQANLTFVTQHIAVRDAIEAANPRLREMMGDSGISMGSVSVNVGSFTQQQDQQQSSGNGTGNSYTATNQDVGTSEAVSVSVQSLVDDGLVNVFA